MEFWLAIQCNRARGGSHLVALFLRHDEVAWSMGKLVAVLLVSMQFGLFEKVLSGYKRGSPRHLSFKGESAASVGSCATLTSLPVVRIAHLHPCRVCRECSTRWTSGSRRCTRR